MVLNIMKIRKGSLSEFTLIALEKTIDGYLKFDDLIHNPGKYAYGDGWERPLKKSFLSQALRRLKVKGLIEYEVDKTNKTILKLTSLGRESLGDLDSLQEEWDGKYRIIIFDIPENKRVIRGLFRRRLKDWRFTMCQRSVWISKNNVTDKLKKLIEKLEIKDWVAVIESEDPSIKTLMTRSAN